MNKFLLLPLLFLAGCTGSSSKSVGCFSLIHKIYFESESTYYKCYTGPLWSFEKRYGLAMEERKLMMVLEESRFLESKQRAEHTIVLAKLEAETKAIEAKSYINPNKDCRISREKNGEELVTGCTFSSVSLSADSVSGSYPVPALSTIIQGGFGPAQFRY